MDRKSLESVVSIKVSMSNGWHFIYTSYHSMQCIVVAVQNSVLRLATNNFGSILDSVYAGKSIRIDSSGSIESIL